MVGDPYRFDSRQSTSVKADSFLEKVLTVVRKRCFHFATSANFCGARWYFLQEFRRFFPAKAKCKKPLSVNTLVKKEGRPRLPETLWKVENSIAPVPGSNDTYRWMEIGAISMPDVTEHGALREEGISLHLSRGGHEPLRSFSTFLKRASPRRPRSFDPRCLPAASRHALHQE